MTLNTPESAVSPTTSSKVPSPGDPLALKWERRKKSSTAYAPSLRSGCTMAVWAAKNMGVLFGGVTDEDTSEETLESVFHCDLYGYQIAGNGRWVSMLLKQPKRKGGGAQKKKPAQLQPQQQRGPEQDEEFDEGEDEEDEGDEDKVCGGLVAWSQGVIQEANSNLQEDEKPTKPQKAAPPPKSAPPAPPPENEIDPDDPMLTVPLPRYNAMLAVLRNTLYMYVPHFSAPCRVCRS